MNRAASKAHMRVLLCAPDFYGIEYEINPWMKKERGANHALALAQWNLLREKLASLGCAVELIAPQSGLPDMVFTANAGLVVGKKFIASSFRHAERRGEEKYFEAWFEQHNFKIVRLDDNFGAPVSNRLPANADEPVGNRRSGQFIFEGEGDALFCGDVLFCGYHFRSDIQSHRRLGEILGRLVISLELADERFYHLDTCFCPLSDSAAIWFPPAFDEYAQRAIRRHIETLINVVPDEAARFACNAIVLDREIIFPAGCPGLEKNLVASGYNCHPLDMSEFFKAGGACKCLVLFLPTDKTLQT